MAADGMHTPHTSRTACGVCGRSDCNTSPFIHEGYPFAPPTPTPAPVTHDDRRGGKRGRRPSEDRMRRPIEDR